MESLLRKIEEEEGGGGGGGSFTYDDDDDASNINVSDYSKDDISQAIKRFVEALQEAVSNLKIEESRDDHDDFENKNNSTVNAKWLLETCEKIPSELGAEYLARSVWDATKLTDEGQQQEALFAAFCRSFQTFSSEIVRRWLLLRKPDC